MGSLIVGMEFQHILRLLNTNVDGKEKIMYALTSIKGKLGDAVGAAERVAARAAAQGCAVTHAFR